MLVALLGGFVDGLISELIVFVLVLMLLAISARMRRRKRHHPPRYRPIKSEPFADGDPIKTQARSDPTKDIRPGAVAAAGIYVVVHREPAHTTPHEVTISAPMVVPECGACAGVHFSRKCSSPTPIEDCECFQPPTKHFPWNLASPGCSKFPRQP